MNIFEQQAKAIQQVRESNVIPLPTLELARKLRAEGKTIVHKPHKFKKRDFADDDLPPAA